MSIAIRDAAHLESKQPDFERLIPLTPAYARLPISESFSWSECMRAVEEGCWYLVAFRSVRRREADSDVLTEFDDFAHDEALSSGGLLHYFKGALNSHRQCLSFCIWESQAHARAALHLPRHRAAIEVAAQMYDAYDLERYIITKQRGSSELYFDPLL